MNIVQASYLSKSFGASKALDSLNFNLKEGSITGVIGPNGAGKTTLLKSILGLTSCDGELEVAGLNPCKQRSELMQHVSFIADTAVLPPWIKVSQLIDYTEQVHKFFNRSKAEAILANTKLKPSQKVRQLSKGMITQLHLALIVAIDVPILVLDEPTLGLDILYRQTFYDQLLDDYYDNNKTIIVSTHQVEEVEGLLTHILFLKQGKIVLDLSAEEVQQDFAELWVQSDKLDDALALKPIYQRKSVAGTQLIYEQVEINKLQDLGELKQPNLATVFTAKMKV